MKNFSFRKTKHKWYEDCWAVYIYGRKSIFRIMYLTDFGYYMGSAMFKNRHEVNGNDLSEVKYSMIQAILDNYTEEQYWVEEPLEEIVMRMPVIDAQALN